MPVPTRLLRGLLGRLLVTALALVLLAPVLATATPDVPATTRDGSVPLRPVASSECRGARAFAVERCNPLQRTGSLTPTPSGAAGDRPSVYDRGCIALAPSFGLETCELALTRGRLHVALLGNSIASQWADALGRIGRDRGWRVTTYLASSCAPSDLPVERSYAARCTAWGRTVRDRMIRQGVDVVLVSSGSGGFSDKTRAEQGYLDYLRPLTTAGVLVEVLRTTPHPTATLPTTAPACLRDNPDNYLRCSGTRQAWLEPDPAYDAVARLRRDRSGRIDLTDLTCTSDTCVSAAGGVGLYRDGLHLTRTYADTVRPYLDQRLRAVVAADR